MKENINNIINNYYTNEYNEQDRLVKDKVHNIEFITTTTYIDKYLKENDKILDVGAGTGIYSLYYADKGYEVYALDLVKSNIEKLESQKTDNMKLSASIGNALDLSMYKDNFFDITLVLGPLYHLFKKEEFTKVINEAKRVTKPKGKIFLAFILFDLTMLTWGFKDKNIYLEYGNNKMVSKNFKPNNNEKYIFYMNTIQELKTYFKENNLNVIKYVATDGIGRIIKDEINNITKDEYKMYLDYHLSICEREDLIGYSIRPTERNKGYSKINLYLALEKCQKLGLKEILITANDDNIASYKTIETFGGELKNKIKNKETNNIPIRRYFINVEKALSMNGELIKWDYHIKY